MRNIRFCKGSYMNRTYLIPTIELEKSCGITFLCIVFLKWYAGVSITHPGDKKGE